MEIYQDRTKEIEKITKLFVKEVEEALKKFHSIFGSFIGGGIKNIVSRFILREILELLDGIKLLGRQCSGKNVDVLTRSLIEACSDLIFILKEDSEVRAISYYYFKLKDFVSKGEKITGDKNFKITYNYEDDLKFLKEKFSKSSDKDIEGYKNWTAPFINGKSIRSEGLNNMYKWYCTMTHNQDFLLNHDFIGGKVAHRSLRFPSDFSQNINVILACLSEIINVIEFEDDLSKWHEKRIENTEKLSDQYRNIIKNKTI